MKKMYALIVCMTVCGAALFAQTASDFETKPEGNGVVITKYMGQGGDVVIPAIIGGKPVSGIGGWAFSRNKNLTSVTIPPGVTFIDSSAFFGCSSLSSVTIPASVTCIVSTAFVGCGKLDKATRDAIAQTGYETRPDGNGVVITKYIGHIVKTERTSNGVSTTTTLIGDLSIPESIGGKPVTGIGGYAFGSSRPASVTIPKSVTRIDNFAFDGCAGLKAISVSPENQHYKDIDGVLFTKNGKTLLAYPAGDKKPVYTIPAGVVTISGGAFKDCPNLVSVTIPAEVAAIGDLAFDGCDNLNKATRDAIAKVTGVMISPFETKSQGSVVMIAKYKGQGGAVAIPGTIGGKDVIGIGQEAFRDNKSLTSITIPEGVVRIDDYAFSGCSSLVSVTIPASVARIGGNNFGARLGDNVFQRCSSLTAISVPPANQKYKDIDGVLFTKDGKRLVAYPAGNTRAAYTIPADVTAIAFGAFNGCSALASITIPEGVAIIGVGAFSGCSSLSSVTIPASVTSIGDTSGNVFAGCSSLTAISVSPANQEYKDIDGALFTKDGKTLLAYPGGGKAIYTLPASVTTIGSYAFDDCAVLTSITIPKSVAMIDHGAFDGCSGLTSVTIPEGVTSIGQFVFYGCSALVSVTIPASVTKIDFIFHPFWNCPSLKTISVSAQNRQYKDIDGVLFTKDGKTLLVYPAGGKTAYMIPEGVATIEGAAFRYCKSLASITIPASVTSIGEHTFANCSSLKPEVRTEIERRFGTGVF